MKSYLGLRRKRRLYYSLRDRLPEKKAFKRRLGCELFFYLFLVGIISLISYFASRKYAASLTMYMVALFFLGAGAAVKILLTYVFPEIKVDRNGVKYFGHRKLLWSEVKHYKLNDNVHTVGTESGKTFIFRPKLLNDNDLRLLRAYYRKYKFSHRSAAAR